ncbi:amidohydrolase family protein [uncultured Eudoraea sp.]|uniref:amidohydrolase family protein n=1 Tax=uncultured Eudoraea sp. TaxID=1035614 RepID=UPI00262C8B24|nr:amidohydrolase family protein [uncultured Eudoraea sp.]
MKKLFIAGAILIFISCNQAQEKVSDTAILISNVTVIDVITGELLSDRQMVIDSGKIKKIAVSIENEEVYKNIIDGQGKYALPGLAEMHAHIPSPPTSKEQTEEILFLYLSNGITTIRGMLGHPSHLELRIAAERGELLSPRIFTSSPSLNGNSVTSTEEAREKVIAYKNDGYDFLKIHPGIKRDVFDELVKTANESGISFSGHVPVDVGIEHALESKYASIDHVDGFLEGLVPNSEKVDPNENGFFGYNFTKLADTTMIDELVELSKNNKVWIVPTQSLFERWFAPVDGEILLQQPEMKYMPASTLLEWRKRKEASTGPGTNFDKTQWETFIDLRRKLIYALNKTGHGLLLGSDAPQLFNVPGFSIHHEIEGMLKSGLSPLEILQTGTINPALFFNMESVFGQLKEGMAADILLVNSNPVEDISALKDLSGVMVKGKWISKADIDQKLQQIAKNASAN